MTIISKKSWLDRYASHLVLATGMRASDAAAAAENALAMGAADDNATPEQAVEAELERSPDHEGQID